MASNEYVVRTKGLVKIYEMGDQVLRALNGVDLDIKRGEYISIMGPSGSGKSTLFNAIGGLDKPDEGSVFINDVDMAQLDARELAYLRCHTIGYIFQTFNLIPVMTALENVMMPMIFAGMSTADAQDKAADILKRVELGHRLMNKPAEMSGGQQQRVAMARALVADPKLLLLDEPLAALDVSIKTDVRRLLREALRRSSAANVLVTHDLLDAVALGDRMVVIENGAIVQTGTPAEVTARPRSRYVADLVGVNLLRGTAHGAVLEVDGGGQLTCAESATGPILALIAPAAVPVSRERPDGDGQNTWPGQISAVDLMGDRVRVRIDGTPAITAEVPPAAVDELKLDDGGQLWASVSPAAITVYPP